MLGISWSYLFVTWGLIGSTRFAAEQGSAGRTGTAGRAGRAGRAGMAGKAGRVGRASMAGREGRAKESQFVRQDRLQVIRRERGREREREREYFLVVSKKVSHIHYFIAIPVLAVTGLGEPNYC